MSDRLSEIPYRLRRSARAKRLRLTVSPGGVEVVAPFGASDAEIEAFVGRHRGWIRARTSALRGVLEAHPGSPELADGSAILCRGRPVRLRVVESGDRRVHVEAGEELLVAVPSDRGSANEALVESALRLWLKAAARRDARSYVERHGPRHGLIPRALRIKEQKHLWGSCSAKGTINLNWRLIFAPPSVFEYVVVHELCHLRERNHQPPFWRLVAEVMPDFAAHRRWLRANGHVLSLKREPLSG